MGLALTVAAATFTLAVIWGAPLIELMRRLRLGKNIRIEGPQTHQAKAGTPAMGGILIVGWTVLVALVVNAVQLLQALDVAESIVIPLGVLVAYSILGGIDDYQGFRLRPGEGMPARVKIWFQLGIALLAGAVIFWVVNDGQGLVAVPTVPVLLNIGWLYLPLTVIVIAGTANAVNYTDGLDGLAGLIAATAFAAFGIIAFWQDQQFLVVFSFIVIGATFGFLWYNAKPAQMFMGDVGSQALGGALGVVALMTNQWLILPIIVILPLATLASSTLQTLYFKATGGKRLFKMAPLHHHFELVGWSETQIVQRWWLISLLAAMIGIALALV
jgi:phospho-N-acetylmuramoyl-pentapeptide-transferase